MARKPPKMCRHKASNRAYVTDPATGRQVPLGTWGTPESEVRYGQWVAEFYSRAPGVPESVGPTGATVAHLISAYMRFAENYYRKHGKPTSEVNTIDQIARRVTGLYGTTKANDFKPSRFKAIRQILIDKGHSRKHINRQMDRIRRIWRWGVEHEMVSVEASGALDAIARLKKGRSPAKERPKIKPVAWEVVEATLPYIRLHFLRSMVRLHWLGACRAQDVVRMRPCDLDRSGPVWTYTPWTHKTEHHEDAPAHVVYYGPEAQELLKPLLRLTSAKGWLFPSAGCGRNRGKGPGHITPNGYRQVIDTAVKKANRDRAKKNLPALPHWYPLMVRHAALTAIRKRFGLEAAQVMGGHAHMSTTEIYAEQNAELARKIAAEMG